jgi:hypothetical protein
MTEKGPDFEVKGKEAKRALLSYIEWVRSTLNGVFSTKEEVRAHEEQRKIVSGHVAEVTSVLEDSDLEVSIM